MKIIKLPVEYIRFLNEENHVITDVMNTGCF